MKNPELSSQKGYLIMLKKVHKIIDCLSFLFQILNYFDYFFTSVFTLEIIIKVSMKSSVFACSRVSVL